MRTDGALGSGICKFPEAVTPMDLLSDAIEEFASLFIFSVGAMVCTGGGGGWSAQGRFQVAPTRGLGVVLQVNGSKCSHTRGTSRRFLRRPELPQDCAGSLAGVIGMLGFPEWAGEVDSCVARKVGSAGMMAHGVASIVSDSLQKKQIPALPLGE